MSDFVLAIDVGGTKLDVATAALDGELLESERLDTDATAGARQAIARAVASARAIAARTAEATGGRCVAAGMASPGIVREDGVLLAPNIPGWDELALPALLRAGLGLETVAIATDVKAAALAEARWGALRGADPAIFLGLGTGVAAAIVVGAEVLAGANGAAGEIAAARFVRDAPLRGAVALALDAAAASRRPVAEAA